MSASYHLEDICARLKLVPFFSPLTEEELVWLAERVRVEVYPPATRLILEGTYGDNLFIVHEGEVEIFVRRRGEKVLLARRGPGSFFGEMGLVESRLVARTATVQTVRPSTMIELKKPAFNALMNQNAALASFVLREVTQRLRHTDSRMVEELLEVNANLVAAQRQIEQTYDTTLAALSSALDLRDTETEGHSRRVTEYTLIIGRTLELSPEQMKALHRGALLHDIGKIGVPDAILRKAGRLSPEERALMCNHPVWGAEILREIDFLRDAIPVVRHHHEWWDGTGYPDGLKGEEIPLFARIFAIADTFDALTSERPYRVANSAREALEIMREESGSHLDPNLFALFENLFASTIEPLCKQYQRHLRAPAILV